MSSSFLGRKSYILPPKILTDHHSTGVMYQLNLEAASKLGLGTWAKHASTVWINGLYQ